MSAFALTEMCYTAERDGAVTIERLHDMRDRAAHALRIAERAIEHAVKTTGKSVIG